MRSTPKKRPQHIPAPVKQVLIAVAILAAAAAIGLGGHIYTVHQRLEGKVENVKAQMEDWIENGYDPGAAIVLMKQVPDIFKRGDLDEAEKTIDKAAAALDVPPEKRPKPRPGPGEEPTDLYGNAKRVEIADYDGSAMEPFISPDGHFLFFNNENDPDAQTDLHFAERTGPYTFHYLGKLKGANSRALDAVPSIDRADNFYFTSPREYDKTFKSIFVGKFDGHDVTGAHTVAGDINPGKIGTVNMDVCISPDGQTLYISRATFKPGLNGPATSDIMVAHLKNGKFMMDPRSDAIMKNVNTDQLEYAPAISPDGRELFFTRSQAPEGKLEGPQFRIMVATRSGDGQPFSKPKVLSAFSGMVEAPTVSADLSEMFFHKKENGKWVIYRALRKGTH